jgi:hypothetical protein
MHLRSIVLVGVLLAIGSQLGALPSTVLIPAQEPKPIASQLFVPDPTTPPVITQGSGTR